MFCAQVLRADLHHGPTNGGPAERERYYRQYADTLAAYEAVFGAPPPAAIWPSAQRRFCVDPRGVRVNFSDGIFVSRRVALALGLLAVMAGWWIPTQLRPAGRHGDALDAEDLAVLAGGRNRFADSLLADLFVRGGLVGPIAGKFEVAQRSIPVSPAGKVLLAYGAPISLGDAHKVLAAHAERVSARLRRAGLLLRPEELVRLRWLSSAPFIALLLIGIYRQRAGSALGEPTGYLVILLLATAGLALVRFLSADQRTRAGLAVLDAERVRASRLSRAPQPEEVATAVARCSAPACLLALRGSRSMPCARRAAIRIAGAAATAAAIVMAAAMAAAAAVVAGADVSA